MTTLASRALHMITAGALASLIAGSTLAQNTSGPVTIKSVLAGPYSEEATNLIAFDMVDFVGWNNHDMDLMRVYHNHAVVVDFAGAKTEGMDHHEAMLVDIIKSGRANKILQHFPKVAKGEWTAVVGVTAVSTMATVARWKDGALIEENLFFRRLTDAEMDAVDTQNLRMDITIPNDSALLAATGAKSGWAAQMGKNFVLFVRKVDGSVVERLGFAGS